MALLAIEIPASTPVPAQGYNGGIGYSEENTYITVK